MIGLKYIWYEYVCWFKKRRNLIGYTVRRLGFQQNRTPSYFSPIHLWWYKHYLFTILLHFLFCFRLVAVCILFPSFCFFLFFFLSFCFIPCIAYQRFVEHLIFRKGCNHKLSHSRNLSSCRGREEKRDKNNEEVTGGGRGEVTYTLKIAKRRIWEEFGHLAVLENRSGLWKCIEPPSLIRRKLNKPVWRRG